MKSLLAIVLLSILTSTATAGSAFSWSARELTNPDEIHEPQQFNGFVIAGFNEPGSDTAGMTFGTGNSWYDGYSPNEEWINTAVITADSITFDARMRGNNYDWRNSAIEVYPDESSPTGFTMSADVFYWPNEVPEVARQGFSIPAHLSITEWVSGDANRDGSFDSDDLVEIFQRGFFERDDLPETFVVPWALGDFDGNGRFDTGDIVDAFAAGHYDPLGHLPSAVAVPEPSTEVLAIIVLVGSAAYIGGVRLRTS